MRFPRRSILASLLVWGSVAAFGPEVSEAGAEAKTGAPSLASGPVDTESAAREIDRLVEVSLRAAGRHPATSADDATFLRRAYLSIVGRIPSLEETRRFLDSEDPSRRLLLVDGLLDSPGQEAHLFTFWVDLLRARTRLNENGRVNGASYLQWIKHAIAVNEPYDRMVRDLLTASGAYNSKEGGATGYLLRDRAMPEDAIANTARIFLGTRIECAQCHNHPNDKWTQREFYELSAFLGGVLYTNPELTQGSGLRGLRRLGQNLRKEGDQQAYRLIQVGLIQLLSPGITGSGTGLARLPEDYKYDDLDPRSLVKADTPFGVAADLVVATPRENPRFLRRRPNPEAAKRIGVTEGHPQIGSRKALADWMTSPTNERFTMVIANRFWKRVMGRGLIEPVDEIRDDTVASNPELLAYLSSLMIELKYDLRAFQRVLYHTRAFQRAAIEADPETDQGYAFEGMPLTRLTAEQMWDSLVTLAVADVDAGLEGDHSPAADLIHSRYDQAVELLRQDASPEAMVEKMQEMGRDLVRAVRGNPGRGRGGPNLRRAADLPSPAPEGHLLREFGQSLRSEVEGARREATVPQALQLMNGFIDRMLLRGDGPLVQALRQARGLEAKIRTAYLAILSRQPTAEEIGFWKTDAQAARDELFGDLVWTLINSHEFRFVR